MLSHCATSGSRIVESTTARSPSRNSRRTTTPSVSVVGGFTPPTVLLGASLLPLAARAAATAAAVAPRALLARLARRGVLRPLDELLGRDEATVLVLLDELEADAAASLVHFLHEHVEDVAALDDVLDVVDAAGADVRHVQQPVGSLLQLDERAEVGSLDDA